MVTTMATDINESQQSNRRLDYLDAVRCFALLLGICFHASLSFMPIFIGWAVMDISTSSFVSIFVMVSHSFRMELFFLIAGFFSHMKFHQNGIHAFLTSRLVRIALPFVIGWFLLNPLVISGWVMGSQSMRGEVDIFNGLLAGFIALGELPKGLFVGTHLWFLYYLLLISFSLIVFRSLISLHKPLMDGLIKLADRVTSVLSRSPVGILALALPTAACLWFMNHWGVDTPDKSLVPSIPVVLLYGGFFLFGYLLNRNSSLMANFSYLSWHKFMIGIIAASVAIYLSTFEMKQSHENYVLIKAAYMLNYAIMMWSLVAVFIGLFRCLFYRSNTVIRYFADASYWLYLIHLPIVLWLQIAFAELELHWSFKWASICILTIGISILIYDVMVRSTFIGNVLNGKRKPSFIFK